MAGNRAGGLRAAETNKKKYGSDFYKKIGAAGGFKSRGGGFAANTELARYAGALGGRISRRGKASELDLNAIEQARQELKSIRG